MAGVAWSHRDLTGRTFGLLVVKELHHVCTKNNHSYWFCVCKCGGTKVVRRDQLTRGKTRSCGCVGTRPEKSASNGDWKPCKR